jgi:hypothetical protein
MAKKTVVVAAQKRAKEKEKIEQMRLEKERLEKERIDAKKKKFLNPETPKSFVNIIQPPTVEPVVEEPKTLEEMNKTYQIEIENLKAELERVTKENIKAFEIITRQRNEIINLKGRDAVEAEKDEEWNKIDKDASNAMRGKKPITLVHRPITNTNRDFYMDFAGNTPSNSRT